MNEVIKVSGEIVEAAPLSQDEILRMFGRWMRLDVADGAGSPETLRAYAGDVRQHLEWLQGEGLHSMAAVEDDLKLFRSWLIERYAVSTVGRKLVATRRFYEMAHAHGLIASNPAARLRSPSDRTCREERIKYLQYEALVRILGTPISCCGETPRGLRDRAILVLMTVHGLRTIEVHRLDTGDLRDDLSIHGTLMVFGKGSKWRSVLLTAKTRPVVDAWMKARSGLDPDGEAFFLTLHHGVRHGEAPHHRISTRSIRAIVDGYLVATGTKRPGVSGHALRHSFATHAMDKGARLIDISSAMGHASITTTQVYARIVDREKNNPSLVIDNLVDGY